MTRVPLDYDARPSAAVIASYCRTFTIGFRKRLLVRAGKQIMNGHDGHARRRSRLVLTLLFTGPFAMGCSGTAPPAAELIRPVKTMVVTSGDDTRVRTFPG